MSCLLITGASGFIGRSLVPLLVKEGNNIRIATRNREKDGDIFPDIKIDYVSFDLGSDNNDLNLLLDEVDVVIHLAAHVHINKNNEQQKEIFNKLNFDGTRKLALAAAKKGVRRFIYLSTAKVYGEKSELNNSEAYKFSEQDETNPEDMYAISKLNAENEIKKISTDYGMDFIIFRPPLVYGPYVKANFLSLVKIIDRGIPLPLASVHNLRSFVYVGNLVHAIMTSINSKQAKNQTFNISDLDISVPGLIRKIALNIGVTPILLKFPVGWLKFAGKLIFKSKTVDRLTDSFTINSTYIRDKLQWYPPYNFDTGLKKTLDWYIDNK